mgnify:FL=1
MDNAASPGTKISSVAIAKKYRTRISETIANKQLQGKGPKLVGFLANDDQAARSYALWTKKACEADGISFELREVSKLDLEHALYQANADPDVHGIMIYYPCFGGNAPCFFGPSMDDYLRDSIAPEKDVEGLCYTYRMNMYRNRRWLNEAHKKNVTQPHKCLLPCTPLAVVKILQHLNVYNTNLPQGDRLKGVTVTVVNRSEIVGRPLAAMFANDGAEVYSVDIDSIFRLTRGKLHETEETVESAAKKSNVIVTGVPVKTYRFNTNWVNPNTTFINISSYKNVDKAALLAIEGVQYVPLVGKVTVAMLERNLLRLYENFHSNTGAGEGEGGGGGRDGGESESKQ